MYKERIDGINKLRSAVVIDNEKRTHDRNRNEIKAMEKLLVKSELLLQRLNKRIEELSS